MLVSIVIPAYNAGKYIAATLASIQGQTYSPIEIIVVDDGSTDDTADVIKKQFPAVQYIYQANNGVASARNAGIRRSSGEFVAIVDSDDLWMPKKISAQMERLIRTQAAWCYCDCVHFLGTPENVLYRISALMRPHAGRILEWLLLENFISSPTPLIRREALRAAGLFNETISPIAADWDMWLRLAARFPVEYVDEALAAYRVHAESMLGAASIQKIADANFAALETGLTFLGGDNARIAGIASANIYFKTGLLFIKRGDNKSGRRMIRLAIGKTPFRLHLYAYSLVALLPASFIRAANAVRHWRHRAMKPIS